MSQFVYIVPVVIYYLVVLNICSSICCYILPGGFKHLFQFVVVIYYLVVLNTCSSLYIYFLLLYITWWFETFVPVCIYSSCCYILPGGFKHLFQYLVPVVIYYLFQFVYLVPVVIYYLVVLNICSSLYI